MDRASRGKPGPKAIQGVSRNHNGLTSIVFTALVGIRDSNEAGLLSIRRALTIWIVYGHGKLVIEGIQQMQLNRLRFWSDLPGYWLPRLGRIGLSLWDSMFPSPKSVVQPMVWKIYLQRMESTTQFQVCSIFEIRGVWVGMMHNQLYLIYGCFVLVLISCVFFFFGLVLLNTHFLWSNSNFLFLY